MRLFTSNYKIITIFAKRIAKRSIFKQDYRGALIFRAEIIPFEPAQVMLRREEEQIQHSFFIQALKIY